MQYRFGKSDTDIINVLLTNAGKVTSQGFELEMSFLPLPELTLSSGFGYTHARYDEFKDAGGIGIHWDGYKLLVSPDYTFNISADYNKSIGRLGYIIIYGDFSYRDDYYYGVDYGEHSHVDGYSLINARIGFESANRTWGVYLWSNNLNNTLYLLRKGETSTAGPVGWYGMPRTYGIQLKYNFLLL
jgi:iron complex outermembrane receptor protein